MNGFRMTSQQDRRALGFIVAAALCIGIASVSFGLWAMQ